MFANPCSRKSYDLIHWFSKFGTLTQASTKLVHQYNYHQKTLSVTDVFKVLGRALEIYYKTNKTDDLY